MSIIVIKPFNEDFKFDSRLDNILNYALDGIEFSTIQSAEELKAINGKKILFAVKLNQEGINYEYIKMLSKIRSSTDIFLNCTAGIIVDGSTELYTKSIASELVFAANLSGCSFLGRPLVEATGSLTNFRIQAKNANCSLIQAYQLATRELVNRLVYESIEKTNKPELLVLHASNHKTSNTMSLWNEVKSRLGDRFIYNEIGLRNGTLSDCSGCPYTMCLHFGEKGSCFYGGVMQDKVYPAVRSCNGIIMLCPNYNDALSANLTAFINRLTALFRQVRFYDKAMFSLIVSGYSGGDIVARQLVSALNMNKSFYLPANFALIETANDPGEAIKLDNIDERLDFFAENIVNTLIR